jgi:hypothetical protein
MAVLLALVQHRAETGLTQFLAPFRQLMVQALSGMPTVQRVVLVLELLQIMLQTE